MSDRLTKVLGMLGSASDGEALSAARTASAMADAAGGWAALLRPARNDAWLKASPRQLLMQPGWSAGEEDYLREAARHDVPSEHVRHVLAQLRERAATRWPHENPIEY